MDELIIPTDTMNKKKNNRKNKIVISLAEQFEELIGIADEVASIKKKVKSGLLSAGKTIEEVIEELKFYNHQVTNLHHRRVLSLLRDGTTRRPYSEIFNRSIAAEISIVEVQSSIHHKLQLIRDRHII